MSFRLEILRTIEEFVSLRDHWSKFDDNCTTIFLTHGWLTEWWTYFGANHSLYTLVLWYDMEIVGILPLMITTNRLGFRKLEFMGSGDVTPNHLDVISKPECRAEVLKAFSAHLHEQFSEWDILELDKIPDDSDLAEYQFFFENVHLLANLEETAHCLYIELPTTIDAYLQTRSKNRRRVLHKAKRNLENDFSSISYRLVSDVDELKQVMDRLIRLHQARWEAKGYPGAFAVKNFKEFHQSIAIHLLKKNQLRLFYLMLDGKIVAVRYGFQINGYLQGYLHSFDESLADYSLGSLLTIHAIEQAIKLGVHRYDFLEGDESYKKEWATHDRINCRLRVYAPTWRGKIMYITHRAYKAIMGFATRYIPPEVRHFLWRIIQRGGSNK